MSFFAELRRRNVIRMAGLYLVGAWLLIQVASTMLPAFDAPGWILRAIIITLAVAFLPTLIFSWTFELTPQGLKREEEIRPNESITRRTGGKIVGMTIALAVLAVGLFIFQRLGPSLTNVSPGPASATPEKSIAVLPFENLSSDKENAFFADGVQDEILTDLARVADLKVISRTSVAQYKNVATRNLREIGQLLGVAHVVEGSVQKIANKVRVNAQLIDARNDAHLWAQTYDRDLADVFAIQSEVAEAIAHQLQARLSPNEKAEMEKPVTNDPLAYDLYLRARQLDDISNDPNAKKGLLQGISLLEEAVRRDPKFLRAYSLMCETHLDLYWEGFDHTMQRRDMAKAALQKAEELETDPGEVHRIKGLYAYHGFRDYDRARDELNQAKQFLPNEPRIYFVAGAIDRRTARLTDSIANFKRAVELDPRNFVVLMEAGSTFQGMRR
jgi:TolB-like protein